MERLDMRLVQDIVYRLRQGQAERAIARDLHLSRKTVRRYREVAQEKGYLDAGASLPALEELLAAMGQPVVPPQVASSVEPYRAVVERLLDESVEMVAIHRQLVDKHGYAGAYSSVKRFVHRIRPEEPQVVVRIETPPGRQAQVDFGGIGSLRDPLTGCLRPAYCFVFTLCYSRHQYVEFVFDQTIPTWIGCHRRAFESFAGVPCEVVVDNLKAAVIRAALEDPVLCTPYRQMAQHYGFLIHPCRVRTPAHKGKTESGVHYVQRNLVAGEEFLDILDANAKAARWVKEVAGTRVHGTTRQEPLQRFLEHEQAALLPLPTDAFELLETRPVMVHTDCHVILDGSYYSAPAAYVGKRLEAYLWERTVQLYEGVQLVVTHPRAAAPGERHTRIEHYPRGKAIYLERTPAVCRQMAAEVGPHCTGVVESILSQRPVDNLRAAQALVGLRERVGAARLEAACYRAIHYGDPHYRRVKSILAAGLEQEPLIGLELPPAPATHYTHARQPHEFFTVEREDTRC